MTGKKALTKINAATKSLTKCHIAMSRYFYGVTLPRSVVSVIAL